MSRTPIPLVRMLDELAANGTATTTVQVVDGWVLRSAARAPYAACNSVLPIGGDDIGVEGRIAAVEDFYRHRDLPVRFQVTPAARPVGLDDVLETRGYEIEQPTIVLTAETARAVDHTERPDASAVTVVDGIDEYWVAEYASTFGSDEAEREQLRAYGHLLRHIGPVVGTAVLPLDKTPAAIGLAVHERGWVGVYAMGTRPEARRRGAATAVLHGLARWAEERGAHRMYLQMEVTNDGARQLYTRAGFETGYRYHYRTSA
jgi:GNAT superfamily N-acetyltransferase